MRRHAGFFVFGAFRETAGRATYTAVCRPWYEQYAQKKHFSLQGTKKEHFPLLTSEIVQYSIIGIVQ